MLQQVGSHGDTPGRKYPTERERERESKIILVSRRYFILLRASREKTITVVFTFDVTVSITYTVNNIVFSVGHLIS